MNPDQLNVLAVQALVDALKSACEALDHASQQFRDIEMGLIRPDFAGMCAIGCDVSSAIGRNVAEDYEETA